VTELINTKELAIDTLRKLRTRLVNLQKDVSKKRRLRPSEKAMWMMAYQQEIEALTLGILALEKEPVEEYGDGHQATN